MPGLGSLVSPSPASRRPRRPSTAAPHGRAGPLHRRRRFAPATSAPDPAARGGQTRLLHLQVVHRGKARDWGCGGADVGSVRVQSACPLTYNLPPAHTQRLVHIQSMLKRAPSYRTLELELLEWQERELFEYFVVVSLKKKPSRNTYLPEVSYQFPKVRPSLPHPAPPLAPSVCLGYL